MPSSLRPRSRVAARSSPRPPSSSPPVVGLALVAVAPLTAGAHRLGGADAVLDEAVLDGKGRGEVAGQQAVVCAVENGAGDPGGVADPAQRGDGASVERGAVHQQRVERRLAGLVGRAAETHAAVALRGLAGGAAALHGIENGCLIGRRRRQGGQKGLVSGVGGDGKGAAQGVDYHGKPWRRTGYGGDGA